MDLPTRPPEKNPLSKREGIANSLNSNLFDGNRFQVGEQFLHHIKAALPEFGIIDINAGLLEDFYGRIGAPGREDLQITGLNASPSALNC